MALALRSGGVGAGSSGPGGSRWDTARPTPQAAHPLPAPQGSPRSLGARQRGKMGADCKAARGRDGGRAPRAARGARGRPPPPPPPRCPPTAPRDAALKTTVNQAGVLPWKFYISVVYFFSNISGIVYRTFSHPTNVRLNRSENMKKRMTFQFRRSESKRYFLIIFLPECIVDLKFCHVQNILFFILTIYILYIF